MKEYYGVSSSSSSWLEACLPIASRRYRVPDNCSPSRPVRRNFAAGIFPLPLPNIGSHPWGFQNGLQIFCHSSSPGLSHSPWWALPRCSLVEHQLLWSLSLFNLCNCSRVVNMKNYCPQLLNGCG